jgi:ABC-type amino acid transport substrate-binding protein
MKHKFLPQALIGLVTTLGASLYLNPSSNAQTQKKFFCAQVRGIPTTMVRTGRISEPMIRWTVTNFARSGFTPQERCEAVSARFETYYRNGAFYLAAKDNFRGYPVLCITTKKPASCQAGNVLVTIKRGTDPDNVLERLLAFRRNTNPANTVELSGEDYVYYENRELYLDVKKMVDTPPEKQ